MHVVTDIPTDGESMERLLEGVIEASRKQWRENPHWKPLYETKIRYQRSGPPERFQTSEQTRAKGHGDCDQMTVDRVAELREREGELGACAYVYKTGPNTWHAVVRRGDGTLEDPARIQKNRERKGWPAMSINGDDDVLPPEAAVDITPLADGRARGKVTWRTSNVRVTVEAIGDSKQHAAERTLSVAKRVAAHPAIRALVPPQATLAIEGATKALELAKKVDIKQAKRIYNRAKGPAKALFRKLF